MQSVPLAQHGHGMGVLAMAIGAPAGCIHVTSPPHTMKYTIMAA
jgi:hypothetical protein